MPCKKRSFIITKNDRVRTTRRGVKAFPVKLDLSEKSHPRLLLILRRKNGLKSTQEFRIAKKKKV